MKIGKTITRLLQPVSGKALRLKTSFLTIRHLTARALKSIMPSFPTLKLI